MENLRSSWSPYHPKIYSLNYYKIKPPLGFKCVHHPLVWRNCSSQSKMPFPSILKLCSMVQISLNRGDILHLAVKSMFSWDLSQSVEITMPDFSDYCKPANPVTSVVNLCCMPSVPIPPFFLVKETKNVHDDQCGGDTKPCTFAIRLPYSGIHIFFK